jgi:general stress protein 26
MQRTLPEIAPGFVELAHRIGMCVAATTDRSGRPHTRVVQPVWAWDGADLSGWLSTDTRSPKYAQLQANPTLSATYWNPEQDTCTADCAVELVRDDAERVAAWERFLATPPPAGFDPAIHPDWDSPAAETFGVLRLRPTWLRVMPGTLMTDGVGEVWTWRAA